MTNLVPISEETFHAVVKVIEEVMLLDVEFKQALREVLFETTYHKESRILLSGHIQKNIWLMVNGLAREVRLDELSFKERTSWFWLAGDFICTKPGFFSQQPSKQTIEILEKSKVVLISFEDWHMLMTSFVETELLTERFRRLCDSARLRHLEEINNVSTDDRYLCHRKFVEKLLTLTKQKYVAEMMGMAPDTLSKLRRKY